MKRFRDFATLLGVIGLAAAANRQDPYDLSFLTKGAVIGDSYSSGIGAGNMLNSGCSRYDGAFGSLVFGQLGVESSASNFTFMACSGSVVKGVTIQANALAPDQQFIIISAGGNDAGLFSILNSCVYSFFDDADHPHCDKEVQQASDVISNATFFSSVNELIQAAKSKLAPGGNVYYVGYAKFFDITTTECDNVSWHFWLNDTSTEYLTQARRQSMNHVVDAMNDLLRNAVAQAGPQVHFIDYDNYVGLSNGRFCVPGQNESDGQGANRPDLFFYQMKSKDQPWSDWENIWSNSSQTNSSSGLSAGTEDATMEADASDPKDQIGAWLKSTMEAQRLSIVQNSNANDDFDAVLRDGIPSRDVQSKRSELVDHESPFVTHSIRHRRHRAEKDLDLPRHQSRAASKSINILGMSVSFEGLVVGIMPENGTEPTGDSSAGTVVANSTHVRLGSGQDVMMFSVEKFVVSDSTARVFHPTQAGHAVIANLILYQMAADNARANGLDCFPVVTTATSN